MMMESRLLLLLVVVAAHVQCFHVPSLTLPLRSLALFSHDDHDDRIDYEYNNLLDRRSAIFGSAVASSLLLVSPWSTQAAAAAAATGNNKIPQWTLSGGVKMPTLALNTVGLSVEETERAVSYATNEGVVHIDFHPGKERDGVAAYIRKEQGRRDGLFLNTKIRKAPPGTSPEDAAERARKQIEEDLQALGVENVDMLMLRDSPDCAVMQAQWAVLEDALKSGKTRSIGVINFCEKALTCLLETANVTPALNYFM
jgi:hypothetical protein